MTDLERLEELKKEYKDNPPKKVKGGCKSCKKKKDVVTEVTLPEPYIPDYIPSVKEIRLAYLELMNLHGVDDSIKPQINKVYESIFKEQFDWLCSSCVSRQAMKFYNYLKNNKII